MEHTKSQFFNACFRIQAFLVALALLLSACQPLGGLASAGDSGPVQAPLLADTGSESSQGIEALSADSIAEASATPAFTKRPRYEPGELVDYIAQTGDTLPWLAMRFNTSVAEIREANSFIPDSATTMPPGMPMKIPIYYEPLWGTPYRMIPDSYFINGPTQIGFDTLAYVNSQPGWLRFYDDYVASSNRSGAEIVDYVAHYYSVSPRLLLALLEYHAGALSDPDPAPDVREYPLGNKSWRRRGLFLQLIWAANTLNDNYYRYKNMDLTSLKYRDGRVEYFDPWQNAATVSLQAYFNTLLDDERFVWAVSPQGFAQTYQNLFGDPWADEQPHIPGSLVQPNFILPFQPGDVWAMTGGPHSAWGTAEPLAALDFAPPSKTSGCVPSAIWATAVAAGVVVRSTEGEVMLDLDGDGDERTGWNIFYLHVGSEGRAPLGAYLEQGDPVGHPSCEGGASTGTHVHIARKYNGEWIPAAGSAGELAFTLEGWVAHNGAQVYLGTLTRASRTVTSCTCSNAASFIKSDRTPDSGE